MTEGTRKERTVQTQGGATEGSRAPKAAEPRVSPGPAVPTLLKARQGRSRRSQPAKKTQQVCGGGRASASPPGAIWPEPEERRWGQEGILGKALGAEPPGHPWELTAHGKLEGPVCPPPAFQRSEEGGRRNFKLVLGLEASSGRIIWS